MKTYSLTFRPEQLDAQRIRQSALQKAGLSDAPVHHVRLIKKSLDARGKHPVFRLKVAVFENTSPDKPPAYHETVKALSAQSPVVIVVGAGPAGYFAALELRRLGLRPIVVERGKDVRMRRRDLRAIQQEGIVNPHSNYCFGEGGAGTYSDGKLYTRSHKRGNIDDILRLLVEHGASPDILYESHPHIGSNKLPKIVSNLRHTIEQFGGQVHFNTQVTDLIIEKGTIQGVQLTDGQEMFADAVVLATGHSARDVFQMLYRLGVRQEPKPFALGVRIEHPQPLIDAIQYNQSHRGAHLPAASYRLACQVGQRGVFSFCMCPGGLVVPTATAPGELVVNGMSLSRRDSPFANSGIVTEVTLEDVGNDGLFGAMNFQASVERSVFEAGDGSQRAPAQRLTDFVHGNMSCKVLPSSYIPGVYAAPVHELLPPFIAQHLRDGLRQFGHKMKGYLTDEAQVIAVESRTSSPIRIPRDPHTLMHPDVCHLYPCGEGAGYAGGILSAAMDGQRVARALAKQMAIARGE